MNRGEQPRLVQNSSLTPVKPNLLRVDPENLFWRKKLEFAFQSLGKLAEHPRKPRYCPLVGFFNINIVGVMRLDVISRLVGLRRKGRLLSMRPRRVGLGRLISLQYSLRHEFVVVPDSPI